MHHFKRHLLLYLILSTALATATALSQPSDEALLRNMTWREVGPANFSGRIVDVEALESDFTRVWVASASGGIWKSENAGTTWTPLFENYASASIGDIAVFQPDPDVLWVGTGEANNRNSVAWGDGIYKSTNGGRSFRRMGLEETFQIARIALHPRNPDIAYVAAVGNLWGYTGDRGLFKTEDGGESWVKLTGGLPRDGRTGATDVVLDPTQPDTLYVAFYQRLRQPHRFFSGGPHGGIFKSTDGGRSWKKLKQGLPPGDTGRIGLALYRKNPRILMAFIEHGDQPRENEADYYDLKLLGSGVYRSEDGGEHWTYRNRYNNRPFYYSQIRINPQDDNRVYLLTTTFRFSEDGGRTFRAAGPSFEGGLDYHAMWIDPHRGDRYYLGKDKGLTLTHDHGRHFQLFDNLPVAQFYAIGVDHRQPYFIYGGTQDNGTWAGPHFSKDARGTFADDWWKLHWGDGMFVQIDPQDWRKVYTEAENGSFRRYDALTREVQDARPRPSNVINYRDFQPDATSGDERPNRLSGDFRFNWRAPLIMSPHSPSTLYLAGNHVFRTVDGGRHWMIISPDLSTNDPAKIQVPRPGGLTRDATGAETHCTVTALAESPLVPGFLWAGSDDGRLHLTRNGGAEWTDVRAAVPGVPFGLWVSSIEASHSDPAQAFVTFDGHRSDDRGVWIFRTDDYGRSWKDIGLTIPQGHVLYVVRQDPRNPSLLFAGSEFALFASLDGGSHWQRLMNGLPTVAIHDLVIHPRDGDLIAATHGRGIWILDDITPLQRLDTELLDRPAHLFQPRTAYLWNDASRGGVRGQFPFAAPLPPYIPHRDNVVRSKIISGAQLSYYLKSSFSEGVEIGIEPVDGQGRRLLSVSGDEGIQRALWDLRFEWSEEQQEVLRGRLGRIVALAESIPRLTLEQTRGLEMVRARLDSSISLEDSDDMVRTLSRLFGNLTLFRRAFRGLPRPSMAPAGLYRVTLKAGGVHETRILTIKQDPSGG